MNPPIPTRNCARCRKPTNETQSIYGIMHLECFRANKFRPYTYTYMPTYPAYMSINYATWHRDRMMGNGLPELAGEALLIYKLADDGFGNLIPRDISKKQDFDYSIDYMQ